MNAEYMAFVEEAEAFDHSMPTYSEIHPEELMDCPACKGTGVELYYDDEGMEISRDQWLLYPESERESHVDYCPHCYGEGL